MAVRRLLLAVTLLLGPGVLACAQPEDIVCGPVDAPRGTVLILHGFGNTAASHATECRELARLGWRAVSVDWGALSGDYRSGLDYIRQRIVPGRTVAVGISYGGTYAAHLSATGEVDAAVAMAPPTELTNVHVREQVRRHVGRSVPEVPPAAFARTRASAPLLIVHDPRDQVVPISSSRHMARTRSGITLATVRGATPHVPSYPEWKGIGIAHLNKRTSRPPARRAS